jgi:hypothetical protein
MRKTSKMMMTLIVLITMVVCYMLGRVAHADPEHYVDGTGADLDEALHRIYKLHRSCEFGQSWRHMRL